MADAEYAVQQRKIQRKSFLKNCNILYGIFMESGYIFQTSIHYCPIGTRGNSQSHWLAAIEALGLSRRSGISALGSILRFAGVYLSWRNSTTDNQSINQ